MHLKLVKYHTPSFLLHVYYYLTFSTCFSRVLSFLEALFAWDSTFVLWSCACLSFVSASYESPFDTWYCFISCLKNKKRHNIVKLQKREQCSLALPKNAYRLHVDCVYPVHICIQQQFFMQKNNLHKYITVMFCLAFLFGWEIMQQANPPISIF